MKLKIALLAFSALALSGCASSRIGALAAAPTVAPANIHVIREAAFAGGSLTFRVAYDSHNVFDIRSGEVGSFPVPAGTHDITIKCSGSFIPLLWTADMSKDFTAGQNYYFVVAPNLITCATISNINAQDGQRMMAGLTAVKLSR